MDVVYQLSRFTEGPTKPPVKLIHAIPGLVKHDPGTLETALAAAVGDDPALVAELRAVFLASARRHVDALDRAAGAVEWRDAAVRLHGLAASFGALDLMVLADRASTGVRESVLLAGIRAAVEGLAG